MNAHVHTNMILSLIGTLRICLLSLSVRAPLDDESVPLTLVLVPFPQHDEVFLLGASRTRLEFVPAFGLVLGHARGGDVGLAVPAQ